MKKVTANLFEKGDYIRVKLPRGREGRNLGYYGGDVGVVAETQEGVHVEVTVNFPPDDSFDDRSGYGVDADELELITEAEYCKKFKANKVLIVESLDEVLVAKEKKLEIGCQKITFADARKIADFIYEHCNDKKTPKKKARK